ncbi:hypothetical protein FA95DRAFT_1526103 [Auriscalpium vulgare]|uniref:Uncharacterized protein n=1 Tax=Auriscalpium vulgare TaxID=40419 RepID=A0ACB8RCA6_9AGAM|nr:hypothetical protein FA95DRAFT_1526103 [Auriscalpium vulgare]
MFDSILSFPWSLGILAASFVVKISTQIYATVTKPGLNEIAQANHYAFSPQRKVITILFPLQVVVQCMWIYEIVVMRPDNASDSGMLAYVPMHNLGNFFTTIALIEWLRQQFDSVWMSRACNVTIQIAATYMCGALPTSPTRVEILFHLVAKSTLAVAMLDFLAIDAIQRKCGKPSEVVQALTAAAFVLGGMFADPVMGAMLLYVLLSLAIGQDGDWGRRLAVMAGATAAVVGAKALWVPA